MCCCVPSSPRTRRISFTRVVRFASDTNRCPQTPSRISTFGTTRSRCSMRCTRRSNAWGSRWRTSPPDRSSRASGSTSKFPNRHMASSLAAKAGRSSDDPQGLPKQAECCSCSDAEAVVERRSDDTRRCPDESFSRTPSRRALPDRGRNRDRAHVQARPRPARVRRVPPARRPWRDGRPHRHVHEIPRSRRRARLRCVDRRSGLPRQPRLGHEARDLARRPFGAPDALDPVPTGCLPPVPRPDL